MKRLLILALFQSTAILFAQTPAPPLPASPAPDLLPDAPSTVQTYHQNVWVMASPHPCDPQITIRTDASPGSINPEADAAAQIITPCAPAAHVNLYQRFLNSTTPLPLTPRQKGLLAIHDVIDPANLFTIAANAGFTVGLDPDTAYGPGWKGFGRNVGYSLVQDATGEFISTFALDSLFHQDPHYHRSPQASVPRRFLHAVSHTVISQHDDGTPMPNYSTLLTYPISAEISNLYVPGVAVNGPSTVKRVAIGLASDPIDSLITEFLPDFAKRVHVRIIFVQHILNNVASGQPL